MHAFFKPGKLLALALCCVLLLFMTVEIAHAHPLGDPDAAHCPLCIAAHVAVHTAIALGIGMPLASIAGILACSASAGFSPVRGVQRIRPPPAVLAHRQMQAL